MRSITIAILMLISPIWHVSGSAQENLAVQSAALKVTQETASDICYTVQFQDQASESGLSGEVQAKLTGAIAKVADLGVKGSGELKKQEYAGVLQQELASTIKHSADCRKEVFDKLVEKMLPGSFVSLPSGTAPKKVLSLRRTLVHKVQRSSSRYLNPQWITSTPMNLHPAFVLQVMPS
jgi:hypothetical protein